MNRLISIIMLLLERKTISAAELARTFEVSKRTIYRDIEIINEAGIPIITSPGINGGIGIRFLLSLGEACECLEPQDIREKVIQKAEAVLELYLRKYGKGKVQS